MGYVAPLYDPLRIAEDAAVLDNLLNGRLELGLVAGIVPDFFGPYGADFNNRRLLTQGEFVLARNLKFVKEVSRLVDIQPRIVYNRFRLHDGRTSNLEP